MFIIKIFLFMLVFSMTGCVISYSYPNETGHELISVPDSKVVIRIKSDSLPSASSESAAFDALKKRLKNYSPFKLVEFSNEKVDVGTFIDIRISRLKASSEASFFGGVSLASLTILPAWSTQAGARLAFTVYENGKNIGSFDYDVRRFALVWIGTLPFVWVNLLTESEADAFEATADRFFLDLQSSKL